MPTSSGPIRLRPRRTELIGMQFDGTEDSARVIGAWLGRDTKVVHGILFTVIGDGPPTGSVVAHGARGSWVVRHADHTVTTEADDWITTRYEHVPPADVDAHALTTLIVNRWQQAHRGADALPHRQRGRTIRLPPAHLHPPLRMSVADEAPQDRRIARRPGLPAGSSDVNG